MIRRILEWLTRGTDPRVIYDRSGRRVYLTRWYLIGTRRDPDPQRRGQALDAPSRTPFELYLHHFNRSDEDLALHSHPWKWAVAFVLVGGYSEERRVGDRVVRRVVRPWRLNFIRADTFHRVDLLERDAWTLFLVGPKAGSWYFWDRNTKKRAPWRGFIDAFRTGGPAGWEPDQREG